MFKKIRKLFKKEKMYVRCISSMGFGGSLLTGEVYEVLDVIENSDGSLSYKVNGFNGEIYVNECKFEKIENE